MIFTLLTFLAALSVAGVAEWFSIVGIISIYAGAPYHAGLVLGLVLGFAKLVNTSWLYRNWKTSSWKIKAPLVYFLLALMMATSMGVFGFLTKSHLEQGAATVDNSAKVERLDQQITREKGTIADDEKVIAQLDSSINSYIGKDKTDKAVAIRRSQAPQRKQLRDDIDASQKKIDGYSEDKLKLTSEVRALQLEVGPIRYIAELFYGTDGDQAAKVESAVKMFTLLIVSTLDPLAIILLIAANHTLLQRQNEKKEKTRETKTIPEDVSVQSEYEQRKVEEEGGPPYVIDHKSQSDEQLDRVTIHEGQDSAVDEKSVTSGIGDNGAVDEEEKVNSNPAEDNIKVLEPEEQLPDTAVQEVIVPVSGSETLGSEISAVPTEVLRLDEEEKDPKDFYWQAPVLTAPSIIRSPNISRVEKEPALPNAITTAEEAPAMVPIQTVESVVVEDAVIRELLGNRPHFIPQKINEETKQNIVVGPSAREDMGSNAGSTEASKSAIAKAVQEVESDRSGKVQEAVDTTIAVLNGADLPAESDKYPVRLSWLKEFKGD
jgi:hypothetical protein